MLFSSLRALRECGTITHTPAHSRGGLDRPGFSQHLGTKGAAGSSPLMDQISDALAPTYCPGVMEVRCPAQEEMQATPRAPCDKGLRGLRT